MYDNCRLVRKKIGLRGWAGRDSSFWILSFLVYCHRFLFGISALGANGCGKTTILESLKFAACGALPPGNKSGQAFVHDPNSVGQHSVKANVKLRFTNRAGQSMVVVRSMEVTQKKATMSFKQLDGVLRTVDAKGNRVSLSHKCSELDRQIPVLLGVPRAILDHVIFCHQEDARYEQLLKSH